MNRQRALDPSESAESLQERYQDCVSSRVLGPRCHVGVERARALLESGRTWTDWLEVRHEQVEKLLGR